MKSFFIRDAAEHEDRLITSFFVVAAKQRRSRRQGGGDYLHLTFADRTGRLDGKLWENLEAAADLRVNDIAKVQARVGRYVNQLQLTVEKIRPAAEEEYELSDFLPATKANIGDLWAELLQWVESVSDEALRRLLQAVLAHGDVGDRLRRAPAAKTYHHAVLGGLLEHTVSLCRVCDLVHRQYGWVDRNLLLAGAVLHDIGKIHELAYARAIDYTDEGRLRGHISMGVRLLHEAADALGTAPPLVAVLEHLILSHHGELERGSPVEPALPEAYLLHFVDLMDSRMAAIQAVLEEANGDDVWSHSVPMLRKPVMRAAVYLNTATDKS